jgi:hypothetical protein
MWPEFHTKTPIIHPEWRTASVDLLLSSYAFETFITKYRFTSDWFYDFSMLILIASAIKIPFIINY